MATVRSRKRRGQVWWGGAGRSMGGEAARYVGWWLWLYPGQVLGRHD
jgi:hypothetical protein